MTNMTERPMTQPANLSPVAATPGLLMYIKQTWRMRDFTYAMSAGNVRAEFEHSLLGSLWLLINPLIMSAIYFLVFGVLFSAARSIPNYTAYLIIGLLVFTYTSRTMTSATRALRQNSSLIQSVRFPRAVIPASTALTNLVTHVPALIVIVAVALLTGEGVRWTWLLLPVALVLQTLFNVGLALVAARLGFHFADMEQIVPHLMRLAMYLSGVMYGVELIRGRGPTWLETLFVHNPFYIYMDLFRWAMMADMPTPNWGFAVLYMVTSLFGGILFFRSRELAYGHV